jgi:hypothetical protein
VLRRPIRYPIFPDIGLNPKVQNVPGPTMPYVLAPRPPHSHRFMISIVAHYVRLNTDSDVSVMFSVQREVWGLPRGTGASRQLAVISQQGPARYCVDVFSNSGFVVVIVFSLSLSRNFQVHCLLRILRVIVEPDTKCCYQCKTRRWTLGANALSEEESLCTRAPYIPQLRVTLRPRDLNNRDMI